MHSVNFRKNFQIITDILQIRTLQLTKNIFPFTLKTKFLQLKVGIYKKVDFSEKKFFFGLCS